MDLIENKKYNGQAKAEFNLPGITLGELNSFLATTSPGSGVCGFLKLRTPFLLSCQRSAHSRQLEKIVAKIIPLMRKSFAKRFLTGN